MLLLNVNMKPHIGSPMALSNLTLSDLERSNTKSPRFRSLIFRKGVYLGFILLNYTIIRNHIWGVKWQLHLNLSNLERSNWSSFVVWTAVCCKRAMLGYMLLLNINRKQYAESNGAITLDLKWPWKVKVKIEIIFTLWKCPFNRISQNLLNRSTLFLLGSIPLMQRENHSSLKKKSLRGKVGFGGSENLA